MKKLLSLIFTFLLSLGACNAMDELIKTYPEYSKYMKTKNFEYGWYEDYKPGNLYFYYGTMGAGKSALAINKANEFKSKGVNIYIYIPNSMVFSEISSRNGNHIEVSKINLKEVPKNTTLIIDEAQFLSNDELELIKELLHNNVTIFCFGLLTTFEKNLFDASKSLLEIASVIREIQMNCENCNESRAIYNFRSSSDNKLVSLRKDQYMALCPKCFENKNYAKFIVAGLLGHENI